MAAWSKRKAAEKARWVEETLTEYYGPRPYRADAYDSDLVGALVATILSQHTSDINSGRAYASLKRAFPGGWGDVMQASPEEIASAIRTGGLADTKSVRIKNLLAEIASRTGGLSLDLIRDMDDATAIRFLTDFHGVGPKTAACLLMFNLGRPVIAVDTHVHRVALRLGLIPAKMTAGDAQDVLLSEVGSQSAYSFHVHLIEHGRSLCHAQRPKCPACPVRTQCGYYAASISEAPKRGRGNASPLKASSQAVPV